MRANRLDTDTLLKLKDEINSELYRRERKAFGDQEKIDKFLAIKHFSGEYDSMISQAFDNGVRLGKIMRMMEAINKGFITIEQYQEEWREVDILRKEDIDELYSNG